LPEEPIIICRGLQVSYGREPVLRGVNLSVGKGDFLPLVGPNGAGKTTLLRALIGLVRPSAGAIETPFGKEPPGYVPQQGVIDPMFPVPVSQIVAMGLYPRLGWWRRNGRKGHEAVGRVLERLGLKDHGHKVFAELSGGMRQKALIARALVAGPEVLILDEPTAGLDQESQVEIMNHLKRINRQDGCTIVMAHHGEDLLDGIADAVCQVRHGQIKMRRQGHAD
jgi:ABC-type Mn2+/Zn2+ transport system ATPase subunit